MNLADRTRRFSCDNVDNARIELFMEKFPNWSCQPLSAQRRALLTIMRCKDTAKDEFVFYADRIIRLLVEDALNEMPFKRVTVATPVQGCIADGCTFASHICGISIVRAGESMENGLRAVCRGCRIGKILIQRDEDSLEPKLLYTKLPKDIAMRQVLLMDPMLATGGSAIKAIEVLINQYAVPCKNIVFMNLVAAPEGLEAVFAKFPDIKVVSCVLDKELNDHGYICPGFGDFGDRYFGTD